MTVSKQLRCQFPERDAEVQGVAFRVVGFGTRADWSNPFARSLRGPFAQRNTDSLLLELAVNVSQKRERNLLPDRRARYTLNQILRVDDRSILKIDDNVVWLKTDLS